MGGKNKLEDTKCKKINVCLGHSSEIINGQDAHPKREFFGDWRLRPTRRAPR